MSFLGIVRHHGNGLLGSIHWTLSKSTKVLNDDSTGNDAVEGTGRISDHSLAKVLLDSTEIVRNHSCSVCGSSMEDISCHQSEEGSSDDCGGENFLAIVPVQTTDAGQIVLKPGWPLLHRRILSETQYPDRSLMRCQISVVQWAMRLPCRNLSYGVDHDKKPSICDQGQRDQDQGAALDSESGALVLVSSEIGTTSSPECNSRSIPKELEGLHEKYSSTCRLFEYQELVSATSNFLPGLFHIISLNYVQFNKISFLFITWLHL